MEILILVLLTLLNGFFALSEIAIVSVRRSRVEQKARAGNKNARIILALRKEPEAFLSAVQVGITLIGIVTGAYGGTTLSDDVRPWLEQVGFLAPYAHELSIALVIAGITYFSIVVGELTPKTIALGNAEKIAFAVAPVIRIFTHLTMPLVKLLAYSTHLFTRILGIKTNTEDKISEEDLRQILKTAGKQGLLAQGETELHQNLFYFSQQNARSLQTHRKYLEWIDLHTPVQKIREQVQRSVHSKFPVADGDLDNLVGILTTKDLYEYLLQPNVPFRSILKKPVYVSETMFAGAILNLFRQRKQNMGVVVDEFGAVEGIITLHDILEAIVGDLPDLDEGFEPDVALREDGSFLVNAGISIRKLNREIERNLIKKDAANYVTLAGFITFFLSRVPKTGEKFTFNGFDFEVLDMDGFKIDKVLLRKLPATGTEGPGIAAICLAALLHFM